MTNIGYEIKTLIEAAIDARAGAYAPYSNFKVGAAVLTASKVIYTGCNIENASYSLTICAERTAFFKAVSEGERSFLALAIAGSGTGYTMPCGACRQVLMEFSPQMDIIAVDARGNFIVKTLDKLLPGAFTFKPGGGKS